MDIIAQVNHLFVPQFVVISLCTVLRHVMMEIQLMVTDVTQLAKLKLDSYVHLQTRQEETAQHFVEIL